MSLISETIAGITVNHRLDPATDHCKAGNSCKLQSGHEVAFVSLVAHRLFSALEKKRQSDLDYHRWVYLPSRRAERIVGYDLSVGRYDDANMRRVRSMHKLLLSWCDNRRSWSLSSGGRDHAHLKALIEDYRASQDTRPYLVIHICGCVHDYRRMGLVLQTFQIPAVESLLRTLIVPLAHLSDGAEREGMPLERVCLHYRRNTNRRWLNEPPQAYLDRIAAPENHHALVKIDGEARMELPILSLHQWQAEAVDFLLESA